MLVTPKAFWRVTADGVMGDLTQAGQRREWLRKAFKLKDKTFWNYHIERLHELGFPLNAGKLSVDVAAKFLDLLLNPKNTVQMVLRRRRLNRVLRRSAAKNNKSGLKTRATACR